LYLDHAPTNLHPNLHQTDFKL